MAKAGMLSTRNQESMKLYLPNVSRNFSARARRARLKRLGGACQATRSIANFTKGQMPLMRMVAMAIK